MVSVVVPSTRTCTMHPATHLLAALLLPTTAVTAQSKDTAPQVSPASHIPMSHWHCDAFHLSETNISLACCIGTDSRMTVSIDRNIHVQCHHESPHKCRHSAGRHRTRAADTAAHLSCQHPHFPVHSVHYIELETKVHEVSHI